MDLPGPDVVWITEPICRNPEGRNDPIAHVPEECFELPDVNCEGCLLGGFCCRQRQANYDDYPSCDRTFWECDYATCGYWAGQFSPPHTLCRGGDFPENPVAARGSGYADAPASSCPSCGDLSYEVCGNSVDDDCDGLLNETPCAGDPPCNKKDDIGGGNDDRNGTAAQCMEDCKGDGKPVSLLLRQASIGPHQMARISSDLGGSADLAFDILWDSRRATRDYADTTPYLRVLGPGFRHRYGDRLVVNDAWGGATSFVWESLDRNVEIFPNGDYSSEPGTNHRLREAFGTLLPTWRLHTEGGDVLEFEEPSTPTENHPTHHARLKRIYPGGALHRKIVLLYEDEPTGSGVEQLPAAACIGLVTGAPSGQGDCYVPRGLLVKVVTILDDDTEGPSFELTYTERTSPVSRGRIGLDLVRAGGDRADGASISTLAQTSWLTSTGVVPRLSRISTRLWCTATNGSCDIARYSWNTTYKSKIVMVFRPGVSTAGGATTLQDEYFAWELDGNGTEVVKTHRSLGIELEALSGERDPDIELTTMSWRRNAPAGTSEAFTFDDNGNLIQCSSGICGDADLTRSYQNHASFPSYSLGPSVVLGQDGFYTFRQWSDAGQLEFECQAAFSDSNVARCYLYPSGLVEVATPSTAHVRHLERRYYDDNGRLWARAVYDPDTTLTDGMRFPASTGDASVNWFDSEALSDSSCPSLTASLDIGGAVHRWHVTVYDADSDGDGVLNELGDSRFAARPDALVVRVNEAALSTGPYPVETRCTVARRNARGDVTAVRRFFNGAQREVTTIDRFASSPTVRGVGRIDKVTRYLVPGASPSGPMVVQDVCDAASYDDEGRLTCYDVPQQEQAIRVSESTANGDGIVAFRRVQTVGPGPALTTHTKHLAWGPVYQRGVGDGVSGGAAEGNAVRTTFKGGTASTGLALGQVKEVDAAGNQVARVAYSYNDYGQLTSTTGYNAANVVRSTTTRAPDADDKTMLLTPGGSGFAGVEYSYHPWGEVSSITEGDGTFVEYRNADAAPPGPDLGRIYEVARDEHVVQRFLHTRDGLIADIVNPDLSWGSVGHYSYDGMRRLRQEGRYTVGQSVQYTWWDETRLASRKVLKANGATLEYTTYAYDGLGRPTIVMGSTAANPDVPDQVLRLQGGSDPELTTSIVLEEVAHEDQAFGRGDHAAAEEAAKGARRE
ncbi:MAG: hypothetical protein IT383_06045, partial [Deltaproteobacteria bacterium]|nr:hypothetical protein [Deltaproteobacteria bacterium]